MYGSRQAPLRVTYHVQIFDARSWIHTLLMEHALSEHASLLLVQKCMLLTALDDI